MSNTPTLNACSYCLDEYAVGQTFQEWANKNPVIKEAELAGGWYLEINITARKGEVYRTDKEFSLSIEIEEKLPFDVFAMTQQYSRTMSSILAVAVNGMLKEMIG